MAAYLAATAALGLAALLYFRARFGLAALLGVAYGALVAEAARAAMPAALFWGAFGLLCLAPGAFLLVHVADIRRGLFLLPTVYSIPIAFFGAALFWLLAGAALLW